MQEAELKSLRWEHEVLEQRFAQVWNTDGSILGFGIIHFIPCLGHEQIQKERDDLYSKFVKAIHEVQQKTGFKNLLLEKKLTALADTLEKKVNYTIKGSNL